MIFKLKFEDKTEYLTAKNQLHLLQNYEEEFFGFQDIQEVIEISDEEAKKIMLKNIEYNENDPDDLEEFSLYDTSVGDDFCLVGSSEWD
ncbi:MAG TPA: hypothetical protein VFM70_04340 [Salinimicrobium sp.]|nr:hypothetical protein [Salinimicrobium sp.]